MNQYVRGVLTDAAVSKIRRAAQHAENAKQALINAHYYDCRVMDELKLCLRVLNDAMDECWKAQREYGRKGEYEMKYQATKKQIMNGYAHVIKVPYCALQTLLKHNEPIAYITSKTYGWRADVYEINQNTVIIHGYDPFGNIVPDHDLLMKYEQKAEKGIESVWKTRESASQAYKQECEYLWGLLREFVAEVTPN